MVLEKANGMTLKGKLFVSILGNMILVLSMALANIDGRTKKLIREIGNSDSSRTKEFYLTIKIEFY